jgi:diacylglycerol kinase (ATP)
MGKKENSSNPQKKLKATILVNPVSRSGANIYRSLTGFIDDYFTYEVKQTERRGHATSLAKQAKSDVIIVCGGDGTVNEVANGIAERNDVKVAPTFGGSGCDLSRLFGIQKNPLKRVSEIYGRLKRGEYINLNLSMVETDSQKRYFLGIGDAGFGAEVAGKFDKLRGWGKLGYIIGVIQTLIHVKPMEVETIVDDRSFVDKAMMIMYARSTYYAGGMKLSPNSDPFSDSARLIYLRWLNKAKFLMVFPMVYIGKHLKFKEIDEYVVKNLYVKTPGLPVDVEGEFAGYTPCKFSITDKIIQLV